MKSFFCITLIWIGMLLFASPSASANNNLFLPGDAYFPTILTEADLERLQNQASGQRVFEYSSMGGYAKAFCGYAGYSRAKMAAVDDRFMHNLVEVYDMIRRSQPRELVEQVSEGKRELVETNGLRVLFYPTDFDFPHHKLGLRYNEDWVAEAVKFGHQAEHLRLCCLIHDPDAVELSWRDAKLVAPLRFELPKQAINGAPRSQPPVTVREGVKAIVLGPHDLKSLFRVAVDDFPCIHVVDAEGVSELCHQGGKWGPAGDDDNPF